MGDDTVVLRSKLSEDDADDGGATSLHMLARNGFTISLKRLINRGIDVDLKNSKRRTALHYATHGGHLDTVNILIKSKADVNAADKYGNTALILSAGKGYDEIVSMLVKSGAALNAADVHGRTALHSSSYHGHTEVVAILLKAGSAVNIIDTLDNTPLHTSAYRNRVEIIRLLLDAGAYIDVKDSIKQTPLHKCAMRGFLESVRVLVHRNASLDIEDDFHDTPLQAAIKNGHNFVASILQSAISDFPTCRKPYRIATSSSDGTTGHVIDQVKTYAGVSNAQTSSALSSSQNQETKSSPEEASDLTSGTSQEFIRARRLSSLLAKPIQENVTKLLQQLCSNPDISKPVAGTNERKSIHLTVAINCTFKTDRMMVKNNQNIQTKHVNVRKATNVAIGNSTIQYTTNHCKDCVDDADEDNNNIHNDCCGYCSNIQNTGHDCGDCSSNIQDDKYDDCGSCFQTQDISLTCGCYSLIQDINGNSNDLCSETQVMHHDCSDYKSCYSGSTKSYTSVQSKTQDTTIKHSGSKTKDSTIKHSDCKTQDSIIKHSGSKTKDSTIKHRDSKTQDSTIKHSDSKTHGNSDSYSGFLFKNRNIKMTTNGMVLV